MAVWYVNDKLRTTSSEQAPAARARRGVAARERAGVGPREQRLRPERGAESPRESERGWGPASIE